MKNVDLNNLFKRYILEKLKSETNPELLTDAIPDLYIDWLNMPNIALGGIAPGAYYRGMEAKELVELLVDTFAEGKKPSDPLLDAIADTKSAEPLLIDLLKGNSKLQGAKLLQARREAADLLNQMESHDALSTYIDFITSLGKKDEPMNDELVAAVADAVAALGEEAKEPLFLALEKADELASECILDILCGLSADERTFKSILSHFHTDSERRVTYAKLLERYADERAINTLQAALRGEGYYNYIAIRDAIEALGGIVDYEIDFSGDEEYEAMKQFEENEMKREEQEKTR